MVELYKKLFENDMHMRIEPDVSGQYVLINFETRKRVSEDYPIHISVFEEYPEDSWYLIIKRLESFLWVIKKIEEQQADLEIDTRLKHSI